MSVRRVALPAVLVAIIGLSVVPGAAVADQATTLFVNDGSGSNCSDQGTGTQAVPFCGIQAAANVAQPGQTVQIAFGNGSYPGEVDITRSGSQSAPITFTSVNRQRPVVGNSSPHMFTITGAHDIVIAGFSADTTDAGILITDSSRIDIDQVFLGGTAAATTPSDGVDIVGRSSGVTISRDVVQAHRGNGIAVGDGVTGTTLTTDAVMSNGGNGITVSNAPNTVLTSNTVTNNCGTGVLITGASTGTALANNIIANNAEPTLGNGIPCSAPAGPELSVAATSVPQSTADYDIVNPNQPVAPYNWGGVTYPNAAALTGATGQGANDLNLAPGLSSGFAPMEGSPAIDSANANAPGELSTDLNGQRRVDDPLVADTGTGPGYYDRGAYEFQDPFRLFIPTFRATAVVYPTQVTATSLVTNPWSDTASYSFDFGDQSQPVPSATPTAAHLYTTAGTFTVTVTATLSIGTPVTANNTFTVRAPGPLAPVLMFNPPHNTTPLALSVNANESSGNGWQITDYRVNYGDHSPIQDLGTNPIGGHLYPTRGTYTVTLTITDTGGRTASTSAQAVVGDVYWPTGPIRELDTRTFPGGPVEGIGPDGTLSLPLANTGGFINGATAVVLNVTVTDPTDNSYLTVYANGSPRPATSNLNFTRGETVSNLVTVPLTDNVQFYNHTGTIDVVVDLEGFYADTGASNSGFYTGMAPTRVLDTRAGTGAAVAKLGPNSSLSFQVAAPTTLPGNDLTAVALNVTATDATDGSYLTVYPDDVQRQTVSNLNFSAGQTVANLAIVPVGQDGMVTVYNHSGTVDVVVDLAGYFSPLSRRPFTPTTPTRLLDTRSGIGAPAQQIGPGGTVSLKVAGTAGVPNGVTAVVLNLTATDATASSYLTAYPDLTTQPLASNLNFGPGQTVPNLVIATVGSDGMVNIANRFGNVDIVADMFGYYAS